MNWIRLCAILAALVLHSGLVGALAYFGGGWQVSTALQSSSGQDDLNVVATVTLQTEDTGYDAVSAQRQEASPAAPPPPEVKPEEPKKEEVVETGPPPPEKEPEKKETPPETPSVPVVPQEEQHALNRDLVARRSRLQSLYDAAIYKAVTTHVLRPKKVLKGIVMVELTLSPTGKLLSSRVVESSGSELLDRTALANLERVPFPPSPDGLPKEPHKVKLPFDYSVK
jgi:protein TonB